MRSEAEVRRALEFMKAEPANTERERFGKRCSMDALKFVLGEPSDTERAIPSREAGRTQRQ